MNPNTGPCVIATAVDSKYILGLAVMLRSLLVHARGPEPIEIYVVADRISLEERAKVADSLPANGRLNWIERPTGEFAGLPTWGKMSRTTYHKLTLRDWLPASAKRAIWLDVDMLVLEDIQYLRQLDLGGNVVAACVDTLIATVSSRFGVVGFREMGLRADAQYFNAGLLVIDLERWEGDEVMSSALNYLRRFRNKVFFFDQEALNAVLAGKWKLLDPRWNWNPVIDRLTNPTRPAQAAAVIHFTGNLKPWRYRGRFLLHDTFYEWVDQTAWRGWRPKESWRGSLLAAYESSKLRRILYPLEQVHLPLLRLISRS